MNSRQKVGDESMSVPFDVPGSTSTIFNALNNYGAVGGQYDANGSTYGFLRGADGSIATLVMSEICKLPLMEVNDMPAVEKGGGPPWPPVGSVKHACQT